MTTLRQWLSAAPFTLAMSAGFFGFFAHAGVVSVLEEERLMPARASGSSAGALVAALWAAGVPSAVMRRELERLDRADFWDPGLGPGLLRGRLFLALVERLLPVRTFEECRIPLSISAFDLAGYRTRVLRAGELAPAIVASCSVPLLFQPLRHTGRSLYDGGILDRPGLAGVAPSERVFYHHITSRVPLQPARALLQRDLPRRHDMVALVLESLPRSDPFRIDRGLRAMELAVHATRIALDRPLAPRGGSLQPAAALAAE